jgi:hypothetical protein
LRVRRRREPAHILGCLQRRLVERLRGMDITGIREALHGIASEAKALGQANFGEDVGRLGTMIADLADVMIVLADETFGERR